MRAILSVSDKAGLIDFARGLSRLGVDIYSTGGTHDAIEKAGITVKSVSDITGFPAILDGRVKTLHPAVHGGILARRDVPAHVEELQRQGITAIDLVCVNLYPFVQTVTKPNVTLQDALENIDIGGPTMLRAAAKNFPHVIVVVDPADYAPVLEMLEKGGVSMEQRQRLAQKAFQHVALYDTAIAQYLRDPADILPTDMTIGLRKLFDTRYGENPHQKGAFYAEENIRNPQPGGLATAVQLHGKELSYNNILDGDAAWNAACDFDEPTIAIVKHMNTCGLASNRDLAEAYRRAFAGDPVSAFGGIVAINRKVTLAVARETGDTFYEVMIAPDYDEDALELLKKKRDMRILRAQPPKMADSLNMHRVVGGLLVQERDALPDEQMELKVVTKREPTSQEMSDLCFGWRVVKHIKSNAIVFVKDKALVGMGAGQPNRVTSVFLAARAAGDKAKGAVLASDAFFPFPDGIEAAAAAGITAAMEPGGSIRDKEVIAAADANNMAMVFTGVRHFKH
ncbi:MAG: bifunctional phosphoribosylaminoimidazolecarboxamide formyltransferase/IMP cyclohydrolase [Dehalococcoidia bacterium]|nr:bifunctional phosphoribosylaminoimidazolecarboxamide formyltransferase/IMP cyclohydrolase [Dehalococcoidia bacterium]